jgi:fumarate hydratase subunit alpha
MRELQSSLITQAVREMAMSSNFNIGEDVLEALKKAVRTEESPTGREILEQIIENDRIAKAEQVPMCQDTGFAVILLEVGQDVHIQGDLREAVNEGVRQGYKEGYLRKSILGDPIKRVNTKDNTPAVIHAELVPGDKVTVRFAAKGGGSENMSRIKMMPPSAGVEGVKKFVVETVSEAGSNPCPPILVGVGIGGTFEQCALLAKKALFRKVGERNPDPYYADLERELLSLVNRTGVGPQGLGGTTTALVVFVLTYPCHIASFPAAVNIQCHAARHEERVL